MLTERIREQPLSDSDDDQSLDIFESSITTIFNDVRNQHGEPGRLVTYVSPTYGDIKIGLADIENKDTRLFSHNLWNAGVEVAEMIEDSRLEKMGLVGGLKGKDVVEVGAGAALPSILAAAAGASRVLVTDYPSPEILINISKNISYNTKLFSPPNITAEGHMWGEFPAEFQKYKHTFDVLIAADTLWMLHQHENLVDSILFLLKDEDQNQSQSQEEGTINSVKAGAKAIVVAGLHTGRQTVARFWDVAVEKGLVIDSIVERDVEGEEREWQKDRGAEDPMERKRWLIIGMLSRDRRRVDT